MLLLCILLCILHILLCFFLFTDIKVKEPTEESLTKKIRQYMDPKFMSVKEAASQLIQIIENNPDSGLFVFFFTNNY